MRIVLASASPRRKRLLEEAGYRVLCVASGAWEMEGAAQPAAEVAQENALRKARAVAKKFPQDLVLGADTVVTCGGRFFGKPRDLGEAFEMLRALVGRTHEVVTGVVLLEPDRPARDFFDSSLVTFHPLGEDAIRACLATGNPLDKAAGYAAQDDDGRLIKKITGSVTNVIGLPMEKLEKLLAAIPGRDG